MNTLRKIGGVSLLAALCALLFPVAEEEEAAA